MRVSLSTRIASAAAVAAVAVGGILMTAGAAAAGGKPPAKADVTFLHLNNKVVAHAKHHTDTISGVLKADGKGVSGETVTLFVKSGSHKTFASTGLTATTASGGTFSFTITVPKRTSNYEAKFAGDKTTTPQLRASHSNVVTITVPHHKK